MITKIINFLSPRLDILNLEWAHSDRDLNITIPVLVYIQKKYKLKIKIKCIHNGYIFMLLYRPKILLISNFQGSKLNNKITSLAKLMNIKVVSLISEGNVMKEDIDQFLWGHNIKGIINTEKLLVWSERSRQLFLSKYPDLKDIIITVGATGFDRYKLLEFEEKETFLINNNLEQYKKVIGIAAWGFDLLFGSYFEEYNEHYKKIWGQKQIDMHREDLYKLRNIYISLIEDNQDILFILRYHPGNIDFTKNEFYNLEKFDNVFISNRYKNNSYKITDLINISDLWLGYETTTTLESWLLSKQTFLINPTRSDFVREMTYIGSPIVKTLVEAQSLIDEYFLSNTIKDFDKLRNNRIKVIKDVIEYSDGKNYVRAAEEIIKIFNKPNRKIKFSFKIYKEAFKQLLKLFLSKTLFRNKWPSLNYKSNFAKPYQNMYDKVIDV